MIGIELLPEAGGARQYCERLMRLGVLCKDTHGHTIRVAPPLVINREEIDWALERFETLLSAKQRVPAELGGMIGAAATLCR